MAVVATTVAVARPGRADPRADRRHLQGHHHQLEPDRRHRRRRSAPKIPQAGSGTRTFFTAQLNGCQRRRRGHPRPARVDRRSRSTTPPRSRATPTRSRRSPRAAPAWPARVLRHRGAASLPTARSTTSSAAPTSATRRIQAPSARTASSAPTAAHDLIEAAGFKQLATAAHGGVCGQATQARDAPTSRSTSRSPPTTTCTVTSPSTANERYSLIAHVSAARPRRRRHGRLLSRAHTGPRLGRPARLGPATATPPPSRRRRAATPYTAVFTPGRRTRRSIASTARSSPRSSRPARRSPSRSRPRSAEEGRRPRASSPSRAPAPSTRPTGKVTIKKGTKTAQAPPRSRPARSSITLPKLEKGTNKLTVTYAGDAKHLAGTARPSRSSRQVTLARTTLGAGPPLRAGRRRTPLHATTDVQERR